MSTLTNSANAPATDVFPNTRPAGCPFDPDPKYAEFHAKESLTKVSTPAGMDAYVVTDYEEMRTVLGDARVSSRAASSMHAQPDYDPTGPVNTGQVLQLDGAAHTRLRRMLIPEFTVKRMQALGPFIERIITEHIDAMLAKGGPVDLQHDFALPIPSLVICEMLGVPYADRAQFQAQSAALLKTDLPPLEYRAAADEFFQYMGGLVARKQAEHSDDLIGRLVRRAEDSGQPLTLQELTMLSLTLLIAGHETTANMIGLSALALLRNPEQLDALRADPSLAESSVEEMLRYLTIVHFGLARYATEDIPLGEETIKAGEWLIAAIGAGNRDESVFPNADEIDLRREAATHLAFGFGAHQCLGQQLARVELREVFSRLFQRIPTMRLAVPFEEIVFKDSALVYGVKALPVTWDA
ncbi:MAG TPA: cytochrome P450 [Pseudonocardiaceae bacterium]|jgi:cytochrome P450|nr:cytochrome P450 [Pseudonocardiaceae bacterium]